MNQLLLKDMIVGALAGYVPIYAMAPHFKKNCVKNGVKYTNVARYMFLIFIPLTIGVMFVLRKLNLENNFILMGIIFALLISSFGRFVGKVPTKVFGMKNPNMFHVYALIGWSIFYNTVDRICHTLFAGLSVGRWKKFFVVEFC